ncbi:MAG: M1 family metallopeptidase, partial [Microlunatus sp.]|nr:M1 family metallopeptidase [Microlunatus sp.]
MSYPPPLGPSGPDATAAPPSPPPPATPGRARLPRLAYVLAGVLALLLVASVAVSIGTGVSLYRSGWPPAGSTTGPTTDGGTDGVGDPYFPDYGSSGYDATSYRVAVDFDPDSEVLSGQTTVTARADEELEVFYLDLALEATRVQVEGVDAASFEREGFQDLRITPQAPIAEGSTFEVIVDYAGQPGSLRRKGQHSPWQSDHQEWTVAGEPESSAWWYPANDHPSDPALLEVTVRVPKDFQAISIGRLVSKDIAKEADFDTWQWQTSEPLPTYASFLAVGRYQLREGTTDGRPYVYAVSSQFKASDRAHLFTALERTPDVVTELESFAGPYPYSEIGGFVPATELPFDGLETATRPVYEPEALLSDDFGDELLIHELAHMWFGNHVTLWQWNDIFTNEAFASWAVWRVVERRGGTTADTELDQTYDQTKDAARFWQITMIDPGPNRMFETVYFRGPMTLQALRNVMGEQAFADLVKVWAEGGTRSLEDFMVVAQA